MSKVSVTNLDSTQKLSILEKSYNQKVGATQE